MKKEIINLALDFGASSGRLMLSKFDGDQLKLEEVHRFPNEPVRLADCYYWDFLRLFHELKTGLKKVAAKKLHIVSIGIDTWGVDYGLLDRNDNLLSNPYHYRDNRTNGILDKIISKTIPYEEIQKTTGLQYMPINTLYQLYADSLHRRNILEQAKTLLFMPDLFGFFLTGSKYNEYTIASTSQMLNANKKTWAMDLLTKINLPTEILQDIVMPGQIVGCFKSELQDEVGLKAIPLIAVGTHDTASAVAGTPLHSDSSAYLSSGTWSLLGREVRQPIINKASLKYNFTNEGGVENKIRFLKNISGLWIIQQLKKKWGEVEKEISYEHIGELASEVDKPFILDPDAADFQAPLNMITAIQEYCSKNNQVVPTTIGELARTAYNGIVGKYKTAIGAIEEITQTDIELINMVGGGIQDEFLCNLTANATGKKVLAGPVEATVLGNIIVQLIALGEIQNLSQGREIIKRSFKQKEYLPQTSPASSIASSTLEEGMTKNL